MKSKVIATDAIGILSHPFIDRADALAILNRLDNEEQMTVARSIKSPSFILNELSTSEDWKIRAEVVLNPNVSAYTLVKMAQNQEETDYILEIISKKSEIFATFCESAEKTFQVMTTQSMNEINSYSLRYYIMLTSNTKYLSRLYYICFANLDNKHSLYKRNIEYILEHIAQNNNIPVELSEDLYKNKICIKHLLKNRAFRKSSCYKLASMLHFYLD